MKGPRPLLLALLLYVTLDLSVPAIPGAFVFDAADSVESTQIHRLRGVAEVAVLPSPAREAFLAPEPRVDRRDRPVPRHPVALGHPGARRLPRATLDPASPSEDPH